MKSHKKSPSTRDVVENAIELSKGNKSTSWEDLLSDKRGHATAPPPPRRESPLERPASGTHQTAPARRIFGLADWNAWLDRRARAIFGISGVEFEVAFAAGTFIDSGVAADLGSMLPLIARLRQSRQSRPAPYHDSGTCVVCDGRRSGKPPFGDGTPSEPPRCDRCPHPPHVGACHGRLGHTAYQCVCIYDTVPSASATTEGTRGECYENARDIQRREQDERPGLTAEEVTALQVGCGTGRTEGTRGDGPGAPKADQDKLKTELEAARSLLNEWCATPDREATLRPQGADGSYGASLRGRTIARLYDIDKALAGTGRTDDPQGETPSRAEKPGGTR